MPFLAALLLPMLAELRWLRIEVEVQVKQVFFEVRPYPRQGGESGFLSLRAGDRSLFLRWRENLFLFKSETAGSPDEGGQLL